MKDLTNEWRWSSSPTTTTSRHPIPKRYGKIVMKGSKNE
jgi:hypothetical protein